PLCERQGQGRPALAARTKWVISGCPVFPPPARFRAAPEQHNRGYARLLRIASFRLDLWMLFVPVWDLNPLKSVRFQYVTVGIIAIDVLIYFGLQSDLFFNATPGLIEALSPTPGHVAPWQSFLAHLPEQYKLVTYMFLHGSALH